MHLAFAPSSLAVIIEVPVSKAYILPSWSTATMSSLLEVQTGALPEEMVIPIFAISPALSVMEVLSKFITGFSTTTSHVLLMPSTLAVISAVPCFTAVTLPVSSTMATLFLFEVQTGAIPEETLAFNLKLWHL